MLWHLIATKQTGCKTFLCGKLCIICFRAGVNFVKRVSSTNQAILNTVWTSHVRSGTIPSPHLNARSNPTARLRRRRCTARFTPTGNAKHRSGQGVAPGTWCCSCCPSPTPAGIAPAGWLRSGVLPPALESVFRTVIPKRETPTWLIPSFIWKAEFRPKGQDGQGEKSDLLRC